MKEQFAAADHYDQAPQAYPEIAGDRLSSLDCRTFQRFLSEYRAGNSIVDLGCGTGRVSRHLARALAPNLVVAIDISERELHLARELAAGSAITNIAYVRGDALNPPLREILFCSCHGVLHHTPAPDHALQQLARALAKGGILYLAIYSQSWYTKLHKVFGVLRRARCAGNEWLVEVAYRFYYVPRFLLRVLETGCLRDDFNIRGSFEDFVMTPYAFGFTEKDLAKLFEMCGLQVIDYEILNYGLLHSYVLRKDAASG